MIKLITLPGPAASRLEKPYGPLLAGALLGCIGGAFDFVWGLIELRPDGLRSIPHAIQAWGASSVVFLAGSAALMVLAWIPIERRGGAETELSWYSLFLFLGTFLILGTLTFGLVGILSPSLLTAAFWRTVPLVWALRMVAVLVFCGALSWLALGAMRRSALNLLRGRVVVVAYLIPPITVTSAVLCWLHTSFISHSRSLTTLGLSLLCLLAAMLVPALSITRLSRLASPVTFAFLWVSLPVLAAGFVSVGSDTAALQELAPPDTSGAKRNVILISIDSLRWDAVSCLNSKAPRTEGIDRLAEDSVVFRSAFSCSPWTVPAMGAALTGLSPNAYGDPTRPGRIPEAVPMLAGRLSARGFRTAAFVQSEWFTEKLGFDSGFDHYRAFPVSFGRSAGVKLLASWFPTRFSGNPSSGGLLDLALDWLKRDQHLGSFLWVHIADPHTPYTPPRELLPDTGKGDPSFWDEEGARLGKIARTSGERAWIRGLYEGEVRDVDRALGLFLARLREQGLYEEGLIVLLADHGEELWEHGDFWHGHSLTGEQIRVPLMVKLPGNAAHPTIEDPVSTGSVAATILDLASVAFDTSAMTFPSLRRHWAPQATSGEGFPPSSMGMFSGIPKRSVVLGNVQYVYEVESGIETWFSLVPDGLAAIPIEEPPEPLPTQAREWRRALEAHENEVRATLVLEGSSQVPLDAESRRRLKSLGYL